MDGVLLGIYLLGFLWTFDHAFKTWVDDDPPWAHFIGCLIAASIWPILMFARFILKLTGEEK